MMKYAYLVKPNEYSEPFVAFSNYESAHQVALRLVDPSNPKEAAKLILHVPCFHSYAEPAVLEPTESE